MQVGAFGKYNNAQRLKKQLQGNGFPTEVHTINSNGKRLHAVRLVRYQEKIDAHLMVFSQRKWISFHILEIYKI